MFRELFDEFSFAFSGSDNYETQEKSSEEVLTKIEDRLGRFRSGGMDFIILYIKYNIDILLEDDFDKLAEMIWQKTQNPKFLWKFFVLVHEFMYVQTCKSVLYTLLQANYDKHINFDELEWINVMIPQWWLTLIKNGHKQLLFAIHDKVDFNGDIHSTYEDNNEFLAFVIKERKFHEIWPMLPKNFSYDLEKLLSRVIEADDDSDYKDMRYFMEVLGDKVPEFIHPWLDRPFILSLILESKTFSWVKGKSELEVAQVVWPHLEHDNIIEFFPDFSYEQYLSLYIDNKFNGPSLSGMIELLLSMGHFEGRVSDVNDIGSVRDVFLNDVNKRISGFFSKKENHKFADVIYRTGLSEKTFDYTRWLARNVELLSIPHDAYGFIFQRLIFAMPYEEFDLSDFQSFSKELEKSFIKNHCSGGEGKYNLLRVFFDPMKPNYWVTFYSEYMPYREDYNNNYLDDEMMFDQVANRELGSGSADAFQKIDMFEELFLKKYDLNPDLSQEGIVAIIIKILNKNIGMEYDWNFNLGNKKVKDIKSLKELFGAEFLEKLPRELSLAIITGAFELLPNLKAQGISVEMCVENPCLLSNLI